MKAFVRVAAIAAAMAVALGASGCESVRDVTDYRLKRIMVGTLVNPDVTIAAKDGSFTIAGGSQFSPPFQADIWSTNNYRASLHDNNIVEGFTAGRAAGGKDVLVTVKGRERPLHGVLVLSQVYNSVSGPAARSYQIVIPQDKIDAAYAGRTSVAFENGVYNMTYSNGYSQPLAWRTWIIWLSATPL